MVCEALRDVAHVSVIPENGGDSANVAARLGAWLGEGEWDVIHFNCGLHDVRTDPERGAYQVPVEEYEQNLFRIVVHLQSETRARLVWATITPVVEARHNVGGEGRRFARDVEAYNAAALRVMHEARVEIDDLHAFVVERGVDESVSDDGVHLTDDASRAVGLEVAGFLEPIVRALASDSHRSHG